MHRRVLYHPDRVHELLDQLRDQLREEMRAELARFDARVAERHAMQSRRIKALENRIATLESQIRALRAAALARNGAYAELAALHREASIMRAERTERDGQPLN
jgi:hypothetical protein